MSTQYPSSKTSFGTSTNRTRHTKEDALDALHHQLLLEGTNKIEDDYYQFQSRFIVLIMGRLGLRMGELGHLDES